MLNDALDRKVPRRILRRVATALDRKGGRGVLSALATAYARAVTRTDVAVAHDGEMWMHRRKGWYFPDGSNFDVGPNSAVQWVREPDVYLANAQKYWYKLYRPQPGDVIVDIGAGRGEDTLAFSLAAGDAGRVIAVEAHPQSFRLLQKFCAVNGLKNVVPLHRAASDRAGTLYVSEADDGLWQADVVTSTVSGIPVESTTVDRLCADLGVGPIAFAKINVEGAEREVLVGMQATLERTAVVCVCCHDFRADRGQSDAFRTRSFVSDFLNEHGFSVREFAYDYDYERDHVHAVRRLP